MALKDLDDVQVPASGSDNWKDSLNQVNIPKKDEWYTFRVISGAFSYAQHWVEFTKKDGSPSAFPVDCANWDFESETNSKDNGCPCCELGIKLSRKYLVNVIDRQEQGKDPDPVRALDLSTTLMKQLVDLKKLNVVKGKPFSAGHKKYGCDIHIQKKSSQRKGGVEWQLQKGDREALTEEELGLDICDFEEYWQFPDTARARQSLTRHGYYKNAPAPTASAVPSTKRKAMPAKETQAENEDEPARKRRKPEEKQASDDAGSDSIDDDFDDDFYEEEPKKKKSPPVDDDLDADFDDDFDDFD